MEKAIYLIRLSDGSVQSCTGYTFSRTLEDSTYRFGVDRRGCEWVVSELSTGLQVCSGGYRRTAVENLDNILRIISKSNWDSRISEAVSRYGIVPN